MPRHLQLALHLIIGGLLVVALRLSLAPAEVRPGSPQFDELSTETPTVTETLTVTTTASRTTTPTRTVTPTQTTTPSVYFPNLLKGVTPQPSFTFTPTRTPTRTPTATPIACLSQEREPNNRISQADSLPPACSTVRGSLPTGDDDDLFRILIGLNGRLVVDLRDLPSNAEFDLYVYNQDIVEVGHSLNNGRTPEHIEAPVSPGTYYLRVTSDSGHSSQQYTLTWIRQ